MKHMSPGSMLSEAFRFPGTPGTSRPHRHHLWHKFYSPLPSSRTLLPSPDTLDPLMLCIFLSLPGSAEYADWREDFPGRLPAAPAAEIASHYQSNRLSPEILSSRSSGKVLPGRHSSHHTLRQCTSPTSSSAVPPGGQTDGGKPTYQASGQPQTPGRSRQIHNSPEVLPKSCEAYNTAPRCLDKECISPAYQTALPYSRSKIPPRFPAYTQKHPGIFQALVSYSRLFP